MMKTTVKTTALILALLLLTLAVPALGAETTLDSGATLINDQILAPAGTPQDTIDYVEDLYPAPKIERHGGARIIAD